MEKHLAHHTTKHRPKANSEYGPTLQKPKQKKTGQTTGKTTT
jgi:hypothetical protein